MNQQEAIVIYNSLKQYLKVPDEEIISYHIETYDYEDGDVKWLMTVVGDFENTNQIKFNKMQEDLKTAFGNSHPKLGRDRRVFVSRILIDEVRDKFYSFTVKWRLLTEEDIVFKQSNVGRVTRIADYELNIEDYPVAKTLLTPAYVPSQPIEAPASPAPDVPSQQYHLLDDIGLYKQTIKERFAKNFNAEQHGQMSALMSDRRQSYTLDELDLISEYILLDRYRNVIDEYYNRQPAPFYDTTLTALDLQAAEQAQQQYETLRDFIDMRRLEEANADIPFPAVVHPVERPDA